MPPRPNEVNTTKDAAAWTKHWRQVLRKQGKTERSIDWFLDQGGTPVNHVQRVPPSGTPPPAIAAGASGNRVPRATPQTAPSNDADRFGRCEGFARDAVAQEVGSDTAIVTALLKANFGLTPATPAAEAAKAKVLAQEIVFGARLRHAVADSRSASFDFAQCRAGAWPGSCTLSRWYRVATMAGAYSDCVAAPDVARADRCADEVNAAHTNAVRQVNGALKDAAGAPLRSCLDVWLTDGVGRVVHHLLHTLITRYAWTDARIDSVLEVTLVDQNKSANDFHEWAIPCAKVLRGSMHSVIQGRFPLDPAPLPSVAEFLYAAPLPGISYEPGSYPGSGFGPKQFAAEAAQACGTILKANASARLLVSLQLGENKNEPPSCFCKALRRQGLDAENSATGGMAVFRVTKAAT